MQNSNKNREQEEGANTINISFNLLEKDWGFSNFEEELNINKPMLIIEEKIREHHGRIQNIELYEDAKKEARIEYLFTNTIQEILNQMKKQSKNQITIYYDFKIGYSCPLLLS